MGVLEDTWVRHGENAFDYAIEEMAELIKAISKYREGRGSVEAVAEEVADVLVTVGILGFLAPEATEEKYALDCVKMELQNRGERNEKS